MRENFKVALVQLNPIVGDIEGNVRKIIDYYERIVAEYDVNLVVFPELVVTGYPPEDLLQRESFLKGVEESIEKLSQHIVEPGIVIGAPRRETNFLYNSAFYIVRNQIRATYDKHELPNYGVFDEKRYFQSGSKACVIEIDGVSIGLTVCEDVWAVAPIQLSVSQGADIIVNINASPFHINKAKERKETLHQRCTENKVPVLYTNLVGGQDELVFDGSSFVMNASGEVVGQADSFQDAILIAELDSQGRISSKIYHDQIPEIQTIYQALVLGVRDYVVKNGFKGAVIGLSGGVDSALTLAIAADALGPKEVEAVMMPSRYTSQMSLDDAAALAKNLGVEYSSISIEPSFAAMTDALQESFKNYSADTTEENIQARCRGVILMAISNKKHKLVLTTGNKSEMAVGYATLYGDMAGGFAPLKDVSKALVYELCRYRNQVSAIIPENILERPPTAELAPDQKDEDSLPPYDELDRILAMYLEEQLSLVDIVNAGFESDVVKDVIRKVNINEYKRRQAAPGVKITQRAFGRERRYPITSAYEKNI